MIRTVFSIRITIAIRILIYILLSNINIIKRFV